jgi:nucleoside-diphosphate-sugar epimerase
MSGVLVTGAAGFTGRYMGAALSAHGHDCTGLVAHAGSAGLPGFGKTVACNLLDADALAEVVAQVRPDHVVHLAAISFVAHGDVRDVYATNVVGTRNLLAALARLPTPPAMTLLASSANVYGNADVETIDESVPPAPANDYAVSKLAMEYVGRLYMDRIPLVLTRPFNYTGVGQSPNFLVPKIIGHVHRRAAEIELGNLDVARDFSDVRVVAEAYRRLLACPQAAGRTVNVCSGRAYTLREVLALVQELSRHALGVRVNPAFVRSNEVKLLRGSRRELESLVGTFQDVPLRDTLRWMLDNPA